MANNRPSGHHTKYPALGILRSRVLHLSGAAGTCWLNFGRPPVLDTSTKWLPPRQEDLPAAWAAAWERRLPGRSLTTRGSWSLLPDGIFTQHEGCTTRSMTVSTWLEEPRNSGGPRVPTLARGSCLEQTRLLHSRASHFTFQQTELDGACQGNQALHCSLGVPGGGDLQWTLPHRTPLRPLRRALVPWKRRRKQRLRKLTYPTQASQRGKAEQRIKSKFLPKPSLFCTLTWTQCGASRISEGVPEPPGGHPPPTASHLLPRSCDLCFFRRLRCLLQLPPEQKHWNAQARRSRPVRGRHSPRSPGTKVGGGSWTLGVSGTQKQGTGLSVAHKYGCPCPSWASVAQMSSETGTDNGRTKQKPPGSNGALGRAEEAEVRGELVC